MAKDKLIVIVGPTASGKSDLAIKLARKFNGEIISADSRQVYRGMDIGTGKVTKIEQKMARHHLLDVVSPKKEFTVDDYKRLGAKAIKDILRRGKTPIICGGTGFYIDALIYDIPLPHVPADKKLRAELSKQSAEQLFKQLNKYDPARAENIDRYNKVRLIRALEIVLSTGKPVPLLNTKYDKLDSKYSVLWLGITWPQEILKKRIKKRLDARLKQGMLKEVKRLIKSGVSYKRLESFGLEYRYLGRYLKNLKLRNLKFRDSPEYEELYLAICRYAKRQMTWFKRNKKIHWLAQNEGSTSIAGLFLK